MYFNNDKLTNQDKKQRKFEAPTTPKSDSKKKNKISLNLSHRNSSDIYNSTQGSFGFHSPKIIQGLTSKRDSVYENYKDGEQSTKGIQGFLTDNFNIKKKRNNFSLNLVSKFNIDDKNKIPRLAPLTVRSQNSPNSKGGDANCQIAQKYSQGKELPDYKQYNGPFNIRHIPENGVQIEIDESEIDIIDRIAKVDEQGDDYETNKMSCFNEVKNHIVQNESDYYTQYKKINTILDAEQFFEGNKVSNFSQMLQKTQTNKLFPQKLGILKPFFNTQYSSKNISRRESDVGKPLKIQNQKTLQSQMSISLQMKSSQSNLTSPMLSKKPSMMVDTKKQQSSKNIPLNNLSSPKGNGKISLFSAAIQKNQQQSQQQKKIITLMKSNSNVQNISNFADNGTFFNSGQSPLNADKNFKSSRFRQDSSIMNNPYNLMSLQSHEYGSNKFFEKEETQLISNFASDDREQNENENLRAIDRYGMYNDDDNEDKQEIESPIIRQMKTKLPFFMKVQGKQGKGKKGDGLISDLNRLIKQKAFITPDNSERLIPYSAQTSQKSISSAAGNSEMKYGNKTDGFNVYLSNKYKTDNQDDDQLNLNYFSINDKQANVVSAGVNEAKRFKVIKLSKNRITDNGLNSILSNMPTNVKNIDISYNCFTYEGLAPFIDRINNSEFNQLSEINIEGNNLGDKSISKLLQVLTDFHKLKKLNLSKNSLTFLCMPQLTNFILQSVSVQELYLRWNKFKGDSGVKIAESLIENYTIKVIDLSYNSLGIESNEEQVCSKTFAKLIEKDYKSDIIHINLSYNQFNLEATSLISESLKKNFSILGFHFNGNYGQMDQYGFLHPVQNSCDLVTPLETTIQGVKRIDNSNKKIDASLENCWICQGWEERKYVWRPLISGDVQSDCIFVHVSTEQYKPRLLEKEIIGNLVQYTYRNMCPPNTKVFYFFIAYGHLLYAKEQTHEELNLKNISVEYSDESIVIPSIQFVNVFTTGKLNQIVDEEKYETKIRLLPRKQLPMYPKPEHKEIKQEWKISMSVFNEYQNELDEQLLEQCFDFDLKNSGIEQYIPLDFQSFKKCLKLHYKKIKDLFKYYSSLKPFMGERWTIPLEVYIQMLNSGPVQIVDEKNLKKCSIGVIFDQTNQNDKKNNNIPFKNLARHNFIMALLRINQLKNFILYYRVAEIKYIQTGIVADHRKAFELFFEKGFQKVCDTVQCEHNWRVNNLWNQDVDLVLQYYKPLINYMFNKYSQKTQNDPLVQQVIQQTILLQSNNQNSNNSVNTSNILKFMSVSEFKTFVYENLKEFSILTSTDIQKCFNLSIQTQVDQINKNRHLYMNLIEFNESLARLATLMIVYPVGYDHLNESTLHNFKDIHLYCKLESMLVKIFQKRKDETKLLSEITVSQKSLFDSKIREFLYEQNIITPQLERKDSIQLRNPLNVNNKTTIIKRQSIVLPTPINFAESSFQNSNPEIGGLEEDSVKIDTLRSALINGKVVRRSNSLLNNSQSIYFKPPSEEQISLSQLQDQNQNNQNNIIGKQK